jgi:alkylation response protein AidB-like acyl-CoA dehydrogenase
MAETFYSKKQLKLRDRYRKAVREIIAPEVVEIDATDVIKRPLVEKLISPPLSLSKLSVPRKYGGLEMSKLDVCIVAEEIGYGCPAMIPFLEIAQLYTHVLKIGGTEAQQKRFLSRLVNGEIGAYALTDAGPGSDPASMKTRAVKKGKEFVLNGNKRIITFADMADMFALFATEDPKLGVDGISAFIVDKDSKGLVLDNHCELMGLKGHRAYNLKLKNLKVPFGNRIGKKGTGLRTALGVLNNTRISLAFGYVGLARASLEVAVKFASEREVAGRKITRFQGITFPIAELATDIDAARMLAYRAAVMSEKGVPHRKQTSMAKFFAGQTMIKAVDLANRVLGGYGSDTVYPAERYLRDAYAWIAAQGTAEVQRLIISREIFSEAKKKKKKK